MGMDVYGKRPLSQAGVHFRTSIWAWGPILNLVNAANQVYALGLDTSHWWSNDGYGPDDGDVCVRLADALEEMLSLSRDKVFAGPDLPMAKFLCTVFGLPEKERVVEREFVHEFIEFLRCCGGFSIC